MDCQIQELISKLNKIQSRWEEKYPNRARGGRIAITGFRYQFYSFLCYMVLEWLSYDSTERGNFENFLTAMETLSDIVTITKSGMIIATQSKVTLRSSSLDEALNEFTTIQKTIEEDFPSQVDLIKYRILCSKVEIKDVNKAVLSWKTKHQTSENKLAFIDYIEIVSEPVPENRLLELLTNNLKCPEPVKLMHKWLGLVIDCIKSIHTMYFVGRSIWEDLNSLWRKSNEINDSIYIWQDSDFPPKEIHCGSVLIGQRPNVYHLRNGYFSPRTDIYSAIEDNFYTMMNSLNYDSNEKIPIFWIGGRSGSGKSVALLHLLANLDDKGYGPIIWIGHQISLLHSAVKHAIDFEAINTTIIAMDDPYVIGIENNVSQYWDEVFALLHSHQQNGNVDRLPIFVACGPTEQAYLFKDDYCEYLEFDIKELKKESKEEREELREWYQKRTGKAPPNIDDSNTLMVQLFFQWDRHESLQEFSRRLKDRLILGDPSKKIFELVSRILSLNRLYIGYEPSAVRNNLSLEQKDLLIWLEKDLHLGEREKRGMNGYWLLHAHLANALYLNWYENKPASYLEHLKEAVIDNIIFGKTPNEKTAPLWAISRILRQISKEELYQRLDENVIKVLLTDIYNYILKEKLLNIFMLPVWIEIFSLKPEFKLIPYPTEVACEAIKPENTGETGLRLLIHKLLQHYNTYNFNSQQRIKDIIITFLSYTQPWNEWLPIAKNAVTVLKDDRLIPIIANYISEKSYYHENSAELLYLTIKTWPENKHIKDIAINQLNGAGYTFYWIEIIRELIKNSNSVLHENIIRWLEAYKDYKNICFALKEAFPQHFVEVRDIAIYWSRKWHNLQYASFVLEPLIELEPDNQEIIDLCLQWISYASNEIDKSFMIEKLLRADEFSPEIIEIAVEWLNNNDPKNPSWPFVWQALNKLHSVDIPSFDLGISWLKQNYDNKSWPYIWTFLFKINSHDDTLLKMGIDWLQTSDMKHVLWVKIFGYIYKIFPDKKRLDRLKIKWINQEDTNYNAWPYIWQDLYNGDSGNQDLYNLGKKWLSDSNISHSAWVYIWSSIAKKNPSDTEIINLGIDWLRKIEVNNKHWRIVWDILIHSAKDNYELMEISEKWLRSVDYEIAGWDHIWKKLYKSDLVHKTNILEIGLVWLMKTDYKHGGWIPIWDSVYKSDLNNINLYNMGLNFLRNIDRNSGNWCNVWQLLVKAKPGDEYLYKSGFEWINSVPMKNPSWQYIWMKLFDLKPKNKDTAQLGKRWLELNLNINGAWAEVFDRLINLMNFDLSLVNQGIIWLEKVSRTHGWWAKTLLNVIKIKNDDEKLLKMAYFWIQNSNFHSSVWSEIWLILFPHYNSDLDFLNQGIEWITLDLKENECFEEVYKLLDKATTKAQS